MESLQSEVFLLFEEPLFLQFEESDAVFSPLLYPLLALFCALFIVLFVSFFAIFTPFGSPSALTLIGYKSSMTCVCFLIQDLTKKFR